MSLIKGTNSYVTVAEADSYFLDRIDAGAWTSADNTKKAQALVTATSYLDEMNWLGIAVSDSQTLSFPREGEYFDPRMGTEVVLDSTVPTRIIQATYELAFHLIVNENILTDSGSVESISLGTISLSNIKEPQKIPPFVKKIIKPLLTVGLNNWWRAN